MPHAWRNLAAVLRFALAFFWAMSAVTGLADLRGWAVLLISTLPIGIGMALLLLAAGCVTNSLFAVLVLRRWRPHRLAFYQLAVIVLYTLAATLLWPSLWLEPLGPLFKNVPIAAAMLAWGAVEEERRMESRA